MEGAGNEKELVHSLALHTTDRYERIRALRLRVGDEVLELFVTRAVSTPRSESAPASYDSTYLPDFVPTIRQAAVAVLALGVNLDLYESWSATLDTDAESQLFMQGRINHLPCHLTTSR